MSDRRSLSFVSLVGIPEVAPGADLAEMHLAAAEQTGLELTGGVLVICQKIVSKAEGRLVNLPEVEPTAEALRIAEEHEKDPRHIEVILRETRRIVRRSHGILICETHHGFVCANAGVDLSNTPADEMAILLPIDPDASAQKLRNELIERGAGPLAIVITDTFGRPWREGLVDIAIGSAGIAPIEDLRGQGDRRGRELVVTTPATVDALAAGAGLLMGKAAGTPSVWVTGIPLIGDGSVAEDLVRDPSTDLFR
ncbi:MAG: coenzyme F420-0:L-glutamate ligase [Deltaproteobacteria bacterium]|nr:coenzyme F420-0:L-glutamate ligase [Deltaproteobacteria bacterium]